MPVTLQSVGDPRGEEDVREALLPETAEAGTDILDKPLGDDLDLPTLLETVAQHYLSRAMEEAGGNKTVAAKLVGLPSYQTLSNWLVRYGLPSGTRTASADPKRGGRKRP